ncbi:MAG: PAS domain S-box protein [Nitrospirae bacterium]|nr:MAG: PAS domain S-box protein [Nitrospirota bacterium]
MYNEKEQFINKRIEEDTNSFIPLLLLIGGVGVLLLGVLDYFSMPEKFQLFSLYRIITAAFYVLLYFLHRKIKKYPLLFGTIAGIAISLMVELMVLKSGGHQSPYYAGMIIVFIFFFGFMPISFKLSFFIALLLYSVYLVPILIFDQITNLRIFLNNNIFLISSLIGGLAWRYINYNFHIRNLSLEFDLARDREQLKQYSEHLEDIVAERTKELVKSQAMLKALHEHANDGIIIFDSDGTIRDANNKACELHGYTKEELIGLNIATLEIEENQQLCKERIARLLSGESLVFETVHRRKDGEKITLEVSSCAIEFDNEIVIESFFRDITEKKRLQNQLMHAQKMESVGTLAGGIAHDFNNILTSILGYTSLLVENKHIPQDVIAKLKIIESAARRASNIVSKLLSFARKKGKEVVPLNLNSVIEDSLTMTAKLIPDTITIKKELDPGLPIVVGDTTQLEQVIINLLINAKDAMPEGGEILIRTSSMEMTSRSLDLYADIKPGKYVKLEITDTGQGIPEEIQDRIFEPFYTTKEVGKGTGLGLAMVYGIIKDHDGYITLKSSPGKGTSFYIYLPAANHMPVIENLEVSDLKISHGEILVIDDELPVLQYIKDVLESQGCKVKVFQNPFSGLEYFRRNKKKIVLVITDILMPQMDGGELLRRIKNIKKDVYTIAISGFVDALSDVQADKFLEKPIKKEALLEAINSLNE